MGTRKVLLDALTALAAVAAIAVFALWLRDRSLHQESGPGRLSQPREVRNWQEFADGGHRLGPEKAEVTIVEFADYQCAFCRRAETYLKALRARFPADLAIVYRHFPVAGHQFALPAARAAECAASLGRFEAFHDALFREPDSLGTKPWTMYAADVGIQDSLGFSECVADTASALLVHQDVVAARKLAVRGTPTFLINDILVEGFPGPATLDSVIAAVRARKEDR